MDTPTSATPPAAAPPVAAPISATMDAASRGSYKDFAKADAAARTGSPLPDVTVTPAVETPIEAKAEPVAPAPTEPELSKRQQAINDRIRAAVDTATADLRAELARLKAPAPPAAPALPAAEPDPSDLTTYPEGQFDRKYMKDLAHWEATQIVSQRDAEQTKQTEAKQQQDRDTQRYAAFTADQAAYAERCQAALTADPSLLDKVSEGVKALKPSILLAPGEQATFGHVCADLLLQSASPIQLAIHLSDPKEVTRLAQLAPAALYREIGRIEASFSHPPAAPPVAAAPIPSTISAAPPPPPTLSKAGSTADPQANALAKGDFRTWNEIEKQKMRAARGVSA